MLKERWHQSGRGLGRYSVARTQTPLVAGSECSTPKLSLQWAWVCVSLCNGRQNGSTEVGEHGEGAKQD